MESSDGERLSQLYLELVDAYKKRFIAQNEQVMILKCSPVWKKMRKSLETLSLSSSSSPWKREAMAHKTTLKGCSLEIGILTRLLFKPNNLV